jgi:hypothetical protein
LKKQAIKAFVLLSFLLSLSAIYVSQIWESGDTQGRQLLKSRAERSIERDLAKRGEGPSIVDLAVIEP